MAIIERVKGRIPAALASPRQYSWGPGRPGRSSRRKARRTRRATAPYSVYAADFNGDGRADLATNNGDVRQTSPSSCASPAAGSRQEAGSPFVGRRRATARSATSTATGARTSRSPASSARASRS